MVTGLTVVTLLLAALTAGLAYLNYKSQRAAESRLNDTKEALNNIEALQRTINERELRGRKDRARTAVQVLVRAFDRQVRGLHGQWSGLSDNADPLEPVRAYESELGWIPACQWTETCREILETVGPQGGGARANRKGILTQGWEQLRPDSRSRLYQQCMETIDQMT